MILQLVVVGVGLILGIGLITINRYNRNSIYEGERGDLTGKVAVVTGGNKGIGKETVRALAQKGCRVIIGARDTKTSQEVVTQINQQNKKQLVSQKKLDLGDLDSVKEFVDSIKQEKVDFLINNAGIMGAPSRKVLKSGFEMLYGVNYLGHFYLTHLLWSKLQRSSFFRVINISSMAHKRVLGFLYRPSLNWQDMQYQKSKYNGMIAYSRSKIYTNLFTHRLGEEIQKKHLNGIAVSLHPGVVRSEIFTQFIGSVISKILSLTGPIWNMCTKTPLEGSQTTLHLVFEPKQNLKNGMYYSNKALDGEGRDINKANWDRLWDISQKDLKIKFGENQQN